MGKKAASKIIINNIVKTVNITNGYYLIVDSILYSVDYNNLAVQSKQELPEYLDLPELKNKVLSSNFFEQLNLYFKDNFQISNIAVDTEQLKVSLSNSNASANLTYCFNEVEPKEFLSCIASKFEKKAKVKKVVTVESLQDKIKGLQAKIRVLTFKINSLPVDSVLMPELQDKLHILKSKIKDLQFKIDFMMQKEQNKKADQSESEKPMEAEKEICRENLEIENYPCINYLFKFAEKTQKQEPVNLGYWIYNFSIVLFKFIYDYKENIKANYNKNTQPFSLFLKENLKQNEVDFIVNTDQYKLFSKQFSIVKENERIRIIADKKAENKKLVKADKDQKEHLNKLERAKQDYILGIKISSELFLELCKEYKIDLPLKTLGWIMSSLHAISYKNYTWIKKNKTSKQSDAIYKYMQILADKINSNLQPKFCFIRFAIYYLIANLEQENQAEKNAKMILEISSGTIANITGLTNYSDIEQFVNDLIVFSADKIYSNWIEIYQDYISNKKPTEPTEKPTQNLLPVLYAGEQKTTEKTTLKPLQIEFKKQVLSLSCKTVYLLPAPVKAEKPENKDYFADFEVKYLERVMEKKLFRKQNSKFAGLLNEIGKFSSVACLIFLFLNSFVMIQKSNNTFENLAKLENKTELKQEITKEAVKTISNLSDNRLGGTIYHLDNKTAKNGNFDGLNLISLVMFGIVNNKRRLKKQIKEQLKTYSLVMPELENTIFAKRKVKDKIKSIGKRITLINKYF